MKKLIYIGLCIFLILSCMAYADTENLTVDIKSYFTNNDDNTSGSLSLDSLQFANGSITGATTGVSGIILEAYDFDGVDDYVEWTAGTYTDADFTSSAGGSINIWVYIDNYPTSIERLWAFPGRAYIQLNETGFIRLYIWKPGDSIVYSNYAINTSEWTMLTMTWNGTVGSKMFVNGDLQGGDSSATSQDIDDGRPFCLGSMGGVNCLASYANGTLDELGLWTRSLTTNEVIALYNGGSGLSYPFSAADFFTVDIFSPENGSEYSANNASSVTISFNGSGSGEGVANCSYFVNESLFGSGTDVNLSVGGSFVVDFTNYSGNVNVSVNCSQAGLNDSDQIYVFIDTVEPIITINTPSNDESFIEELVTYNASCSDENLFYYDMTIRDSASNIVYSFYEENLTVDFLDHEASNFTSDFVDGQATMNITCADGHTAKELGKLKNPRRIQNNLIDFDYTEVSIVESGVNLHSVREKDRYSFVYDSPSNKNSLTWRLSGDWIEVKGSEYCGHIIDVKNNLWFDAEDDNVKNCKVTIGDGYALVTANFKNPAKSGWSRSLGELNVNSKVINFSVRENNPPSVELVSPANNSFVNDVIVLFAFNITDDYNDSVNYTLFVGENGTSFIDCLSELDVNTTGGYFVNSSSNCTFFDGVNYGWFVNASDGINSSESETFNFTYNFSGSTVTDLAILPIPLANDSNAFCNYTFINSTGGSGNDLSNITWYINDVFFNISECYQNLANESTACGGTADGTYDFSQLFEGEKIADGNYSTFAGFSSNDIFFSNFSKPNVSYDVALWEIRTDISFTNYSIPGVCFNQTPLQLRMRERLGVGLDIDASCYNGSAWMDVATNIGLTEVYEQSIRWNMSNYDILPYTAYSDGDKVTCEVSPYDGMSAGVDQNVSTFADFTFPNISSSYLNRSLFIFNNISSSFNITDNVALDIINFSVDGVVLDSLSGLGVTEYIYSVNLNYSDYSVGLHNFSFYVEDLYGLNSILNYYYFVIGNFSVSFDPFIVAGYDYNFYLDVVLGALPFDYNSFTRVGLLDWNGTNYTGTIDNSDNSSINISYELSVPLLDGSESIDHLWHFRIDNFTGGYLNTSVFSQNVTGLILDVCNDTLIYPVLNFTYFDEITNNPINATNSYNLVTNDGTYTSTLTGSFAGITNSFCTNLPPDNVTFNWEATGTVILNSSQYVSRVFNYVSGFELDMSNNPTNNVSLYLIGINDSTSVTFTWLTTEFQVVDGLMLVYRCNLDGSRSLVESIPIVGGEAVANIELLTAIYSYEVVIDGVTFSSPGFTTCHTESQESRTFYVDVSAVNVTPVVGLFLVDCSLTNISADTYSMTWSSNPEDTSELEACIVAKRHTLYNYTEFFRNCTNASSGTLISSISDSSSAYTVSGEITQAGVKGYCRNEISAFEGNDVTDLFGLTAVLSIAFLIIAMVLAFATDGEAHPLMTGVAFVASWILGLFAFPWEAVSTILAFLVIILIVGRYSKKQSVR